MSTLKRVKHAKPASETTSTNDNNESQTSTQSKVVEVVPFMCEIPEETRKLLELRFCVYPVCDPSSQKWSYTIVDNNHKKSTVTSSEANGDNADRLKLLAINAAIDSIYSSHDTNIHQHINVEVNTDSIYCTNVLREWMYKWVETNFDNRPNGDLLLQSYQTILPYKDNIKLCWQPTKQIALIANI